MLSSEENNQASDSFQNSVIDVLSTSLSINGRLNPIMYAVTGATNTNKAAFCRNYLESISHSGKPDEDRVLNNLDPEVYSDSSSSTQAFGVGYLLNDQGVQLKQSTVSTSIESDVNTPTNVYTFFDVIKTLTLTPNSLSVSS